MKSVKGDCSTLAPSPVPCPSNRPPHQSASAGSSPVGLDKRQHALPEHNKTGIIVGGLLSVRSPPRQRHSTGNLSTVGVDPPAGSEGRPRKGILKRPHTFHERQRPSPSPVSYPAAFLSDLSTRKPSSATPAQHGSGKSSMAEKKVMLASMPQQQHVEFADSHAVTVFGDTTTDTEAGAAEPMAPARPQSQSAAVLTIPAAISQLHSAFAFSKRTNAPPAAIVPPLIRQPKVDLLAASRSGSRPSAAAGQSAGLAPSSASASAGIGRAKEGRPKSERPAFGGAWSRAEDGQAEHESSPSTAEGSESGGSGGPAPGAQSHIVGKWWFGKSTKFVVHCDRRGCSHGHSRETTPSAEGEQSAATAADQPYLTPTQRRQHEVGALRKELRRSQLANREKEHHLAQLRDRLTEIETIMASSTSAQMVQCAQLRQKLGEQEEEFGAERDALVDRYEHKVRQLVQETVDLRAEIARKDRALAERISVQKQDRAVQTQEVPLVVECNQPIASLPPTSPEREGQRPEAEETDNEGEGERTDSGGGPPVPVPMFVPSSAAGSQSAPVTPSKGPATAGGGGGGEGVQVHIGAEVLATLEAYRAETVVWRTRTAQLELILQDLLLREGVRNSQQPIATIALTTAEFGPAETDGDERQPARGKAESREQSVQRKLGTSGPSTPSLGGGGGGGAGGQGQGECQQPGCAERGRKTAEEKGQLVERVGRLELELRAMGQQNEEREREAQRAARERERERRERKELAALAEKRLCETKAQQMTLHTVQSERDRLDQALAYLERRCHVLEQIGLGEGIVLAEEDHLGGGALQPEFRVRTSKGSQTGLTGRMMDWSERELGDLQIQIKGLQSTFAEDKAEMCGRLADIGQMLSLKMELVGKLTGQLDQAARRAKLTDERHQAERDAFARRLGELGRIAERVPVLEAEMERAFSEKSHAELRLRAAENQLDEALEQALDTALERNRLREDYWTEKVDTVDRERRELGARLEHERRVAGDRRLEWELQRAELDRRLASAIEHVSVLNSKLNCPRRDAQCQVCPRSSNKYVACRPNQRDQGTAAELRDVQMEVMREELGRLIAEREMLAREMDRMEAEAQQAVERIQWEQRQKRTRGKSGRQGASGGSSLAATFNRHSGLVRLLQVPGAGGSAAGDSLSIASLPTVLDHAAGQLFAGNGLLMGTRGEGEDESGMTMTSAEREEERREMGEEEEGQGRQQYREQSLPLGQHLLAVPFVPGRCHSAPRNVEVRAEGSDRIGGHADAAEAELRVRIDVPEGGEEEEQQMFCSARVRARVLALRQRIRQLTNTKAADGIGDLFEQLDAWLREMAETERRTLDAREQMETLKRERDRLRERLKDAELELEIYRTEPRRAAVERANLFGQVRRSTSAEQLGHGGPPLTARQLRRWKEIAGTTFREVNQLRRRLAIADDERFSLRNQLSMVKGELAMAKCESRLAAERGGHWPADEESEGTLESYNRWLGGDRWQSVPELDKEEMLEKMVGRARGGRRREGKGTGGGGKPADGRETAEILNEAMRRQLVTAGEERDALREQMDRQREQLEKQQLEQEELQSRWETVQAEGELLRRENEMYEQKCVDMDRERQQMYLVMFRKGQQAANQETNYEMDKAEELQVVLRFLHDAFFYYLLNKGNAREHLQAIMTMLNFTAEQKDQVHRRRGKSH